MQSWPGGYTTTLIIPITTTVTSWTVDVAFPAAISNLEVSEERLIFLLSYWENGAL